MSENSEAIIEQGLKVAVDCVCYQASNMIFWCPANGKLCREKGERVFSNILTKENERLYVKLGHSYVN